MTAYKNFVKSLCFFIPIIMICCQGTKQHVTDRQTRINNEKEIESRIYDYMSARKVNNLQKMYSFFTPSYKEKVSYKTFIDSPLEPTLGLLSFVIQGIFWKSETQVEVWITEYSKPSGIPTFLLNNNKQFWMHVDKAWFLERETPDESRIQIKCGGGINLSPSESESMCGN
jgi:hypothetical protein